MSVVLVLAFLTVLAPQAPDPGAKPRDERRLGEEAGKMIDAYVVSNLQESLGLSEEQFLRVLPLVRKLQTDRREVFLGRMRGVRELRRVLQSGSGTEPKVVEQLREVKRLESEGLARIQKDLEAIDAALTPLQQAKFRVMESEVERRIRDILGKARRPPGARGRGPGDPDEALPPR